MTTQKYVAGLLFNDQESEVALILKNSGPEVLHNKWNAIGGKIDSWRHKPHCAIWTIGACDQMNFDPCTCKGESSEEAMRREFAEEAGVVVDCWQKFLVLTGLAWQVDFYKAASTELLGQCSTKTSEEVKVCWLRSLPDNIVPNLRWIIPMALEHPDDHIYVYRVQEAFPLAKTL